MNPTQTGGPSIFADNTSQAIGWYGVTGADVIILALIVFLVASVWLAFKKAGKPGWAAIVPFYNGWTYCVIGGLPGWLYLIPFVNIIALIIASLEVARRFGKSGEFGLLIIFLPFIGWPILGFGDARYNLPSVTQPEETALMAAAKRPVLLALVIALLMAGISIGSFGVGLFDGHLADLHLPAKTRLNTNLPATPDYSTVNQVYKSLVENYDGKLTEAQMINGLKHGLAQSTNDPYTEYFTPQEAKAFNQELNNQFSGIGAELGQEDSDGNLQVIAPIAGTPAAQAGLQAGDLITSINGTSTTGMSIDAAVHKIRGPAGSKVTLQIVRNKTTPLTLSINRQNITVPSVNTKILPGNIGYMQITSFSDDTAALAQKAAQQLKGQHVKGIVLDLRNDPGGLLDGAVKVSSLWLPQGKLILQEKRGSEVVQSYYSDGNDPLNGIPTAVLANGGSASAAEITAGALHDNGAAYVIGQKTYGKGVVQQLINFCEHPPAYGKTCNGDAGQLKVTVASWYRPDGKNINHLGITPDEAITPAAGDKVDGPDAQLQSAESYLSK